MASCLRALRPMRRGIGPGDGSLDGRDRPGRVLATRIRSGALRRATRILAEGLWRKDCIGLNLEATPASILFPPVAPASGAPALSPSPALPRHSRMAHPNPATQS